MSREQVRRNVVQGTLAGYLRLVLRMGLGLVTFRLLYQTLSPEEFGFWSLLWSLFGYGILLDFGFGFAAQKRVAELSVRGDWDTLSQVLSTILTTYVASALIAAGAGVALAGPLVDLFGIDPGHRDTFRDILRIFCVGVGLAFPLGLFPEILQGQQRYTTASNIGIVSLLANFIVVVLALRLQLGLAALVILALLAVLVPYALAGWLALRHMPQVRLHPSLFSRSALVETTRFGFYAYLNMLSNVLRAKADQPVISAILGVSAITPYQGGSKVGEMFGMLTRQIADVLSPTAAHLHAKGDGEGLRLMLIQGLRFSVLAATPLALVTAAYMEGAIRILTGLAHPTPEMYWAGQILLLWYYSLALTHWVYKRMFLMAGQERRMMWQGVAEACANLALGILLTYTTRSILGVAIGSLIPSALFGWGLLWGWTAREAGLSRASLFRKVILPAWTACLPAACLAIALHFQPWWKSGSTLPLVLAESTAILAVAAAGLWKLALSPAERSGISARITSRLRR